MNIILKHNFGYEVASVSDILGFGRPFQHILHMQKKDNKRRKSSQITRRARRRKVRRKQEDEDYAAGAF